MGVFALNLDMAQACWALHAAIGRAETHLLVEAKSLFFSSYLQLPPLVVTNIDKF